MTGTKPITKAEMENFAVKLTDDSPNHDAWLSIVQYGIGTLLENQALFIEIIFREAAKQRDRKNVAHRAISDEARAIFEELGLKLTIQA